MKNLPYSRALLLWTATTCAWDVTGTDGELMRTERQQQLSSFEEIRSERYVGPKTLRGQQRQMLKGKESTPNNIDTMLGDSDKGNVRTIVQYTSEKGKQSAISRAKSVIKLFDADNALVVTLDKTDLKKLEKTEGIETVEIDSPVMGFMDDSSFDFYHDVLFDDMDRTLAEVVPYGIQMVQADLVDVGPFVPTVCIVDTGYALGHPDLPSDPAQVTGTSRNNAYGGTQSWPWNVDMNGHGSHVAGVIAAASGNGMGVVGAGEIKLHIARGLSDSSRAFQSDILEAIDDCIDAKANIITMSLGGNSVTTVAAEKYRSAVEDHGMIMIAAAGNHGELLHQYPASHPSVISVAAVYEWRKWWDNSNISDQVELAAPGHRVLSTTTSTNAVHTSDFSFPADKIAFSLEQEVSGNLVYCGAGNSPCPNSQDSICLMVRWSERTVSSLVETCQQAGGVGVILFSDGTASGGWSAQTQIPAVRVTTERGQQLLDNYENQPVSIGFRDGDEKEYTYAHFTGTSMATPHVAAVAALVWSHFPECDNHQIRHALAASAQDQGLPGCDWDYGYGIVQAQGALDYLNEHGCSDSVLPSRGGCTTL